MTPQSFELDDSHARTPRSRRARSRTQSEATDRHRRIVLINLIVVKFKHKCRVCACSLVVVRQVVDCKRFSDYKAGLSCFAIEICLVSMNPTDRYRRSFLFNLVVVKFKYKCHVCVCSLVVVRELVDYERFRDYKAGLPCFVIETRPTDTGAVFI